MSAHIKSLGILVARLIVRGDVSRAHAEAAGRIAWSVSEARAISGACEYARSKYGAPVSFAQFCEAAFGSLVLMACLVAAPAYALPPLPPCAFPTHGDWSQMPAYMAPPFCSFSSNPYQSAMPAPRPLCSLPSNPYPEVRTKGEAAVVRELERDAMETRDAVDDYLDKTPMPEVDMPVVRNLLSEIADRVRCLQPLDPRAANRVVSQLRTWVAAVERELQLEEWQRARVSEEVAARETYDAALMRSCIEYCKRAEPACAPEQCFVEGAP